MTDDPLSAARGCIAGLIVSAALWLLLLLLLMGCASAPYLDMKASFQHNRGSDWVLQPERKWGPGESESRLAIAAGLEWDHQIDCYVESVLFGPWNRTSVGCAKRFGRVRGVNKPGLFFEAHIEHQFDSLTSPFLRTDQKQWQGHNPFMTLRAGVVWGHQIRCPAISSGKSVFQGAPFESEDHAPDLYWVNVDCTVRLFGKTGAWR